MAAIRECRAGEFQTFKYTNDTLTGNLAATAIDTGTVPTGVYLFTYNIRLNANVGSSTVTAITVGGQNLLALNSLASVSGAAAIDTQYGGAGLVQIGTANPTVATTTSTSPQYDLSVTLARIGDFLP